MSSRNVGHALCIPLTCVCLLGGSARADAQTAVSPTNTIQPAQGAGGLVSSASEAAGGLLDATIDDFRRLPSDDTLKWLGIGALAVTLGRPVDRPVSHGLSTSPLLEDLFDPGETLGGARVQLGAALATYAVGRLTQSPKITLVGADLLRAQIVSQTLTAAVKLSVRRTRPDGTHYSFPSGHASVTFASATVLQRDLGWKVGIPAYGLATYVAASRIQERRHYLSDVAFGAAIGILAGRTVTIGRGAGSFALVPVPAPGGGSVSFTWVGRQ